jgi:hypothetical protein
VLKLFSILALAAIAFPLAAEDKILAEIDSHASYIGADFSAEYTVTQRKAVDDKTGKSNETSTTLAVYRRDAEDKYVLVMLKPEADKGKGILRIGNSLWKYFPVSRRFEVTSAKDQLQNSNVRFSDFNASSLAKDYKVVSTDTEKLGKLDTTVVTLVALNDQVTFPRAKLWITADYLVRKREDYSLSGQLLRTTAILTYTKIGQWSVPNELIILDQLSGQMVNGTFVNDRTLVKIANPQFEKLGDLTFSQAYLEMLGR